ncbi:hypothetical protein [Clostridium sp.]|uniref:hypothetical protein n=2 Tax=Clostridium sp. TaxID=1506 RepID=UPI003522A09F
MGKQLDLLHKLMLDEEINRKEKDMLIALKSFDFEDSNIISVGLQTLLDYFCIKNKKAIYSVLKTLQDKKYIRIEKNDGKKNIYVIIKDYLLSNNPEESRYTDVSTIKEGRYVDVAGNSQNSYADVPSYEESRYTNVSTKEEGRYVDVTGNSQDSYADVSSYAESRYTNVSTIKEGRYADVTGNSQDSYADVTGNAQDSYADVPSYEESRYTDVSTKEDSRYIDVTGNAQDSYTDVPSYAKSRYVDVPSDDQGRYDNVSTSRNNIYINNNNNINNIYNNKIYINIINHWNSKKIGEVVSLNIKIIESINNAMTKYSFDEIKKAIDNYANVYNSDYFYDFQWHLPYFLTRNNAIGKFVDNGDIWLRYKQKY